MAHVFKGSHSFTCTPCIYLLMEWTILVFVFPVPSWYSFTDPGGMEGWVGLGFLHRSVYQLCIINCLLSICSKLSVAVQILPRAGPESVARSLLPHCRLWIFIHTSHSILRWPTDQKSNSAVCILIASHCFRMCINLFILVCEGMLYISDFRTVPENVFTLHDDSKAFFWRGS